MPTGRDEYGAVVLEAAASLFANGAATDDVVDLIHRADQDLATGGGKLIVLPQWGELHVVRQAASGDAQLVVLPVTPAGMSVNRVMATTAVVVRAMGRASGLDSVRADVRRATALPPLPLPVFAVGAAAGACSLAALFGERGLAFFFVALAGAVGAVVRRGLLRIGGGLLTQDVCAAFVAGLAAVLARRVGSIADISLIAAAPCMILLPGPHLLNGALDLIAYRLPLGIARLGFAVLALAALSMGLLTGLAAGGLAFPLTLPSAPISLWVEVVAGGVAAACYAISYATPLRIVAWPAVLGAAAHCVHWFMVTRLGAAPAVAATVASLLVGVVMVPVARRHHLPFAGVAFASVVSMLPGAFIFALSSGLLAVARPGRSGGNTLIGDVVANAATTFLVVAGLTLGLAVPKALHGMYRAQFHPSGKV